MRNILVTGVGGGVGQSIIKCLQRSDYSIIGADAEYLGTGLYAVEKAYHVPYAHKDGYIDALLDICQIENCSIIFPGLDAELLPLSSNKDKFTRIGVIPVVSKRNIIEICDDKLHTYQFLIGNGINAPKTFQLGFDITRHLSYPIILKPKKGGARSQGVYYVDNDQELNFRLSNINICNYVAQEYIEGPEYTCGSINFEGNCFGIIIMERILRDGDTYKAFVVKNFLIQDLIQQVAEILIPFGPCNFQLRIRDGEAYIFEINPRCSGTSYCRALAGFNQPLMATQYLLENKLPTFSIKEITILRYLNELVVNNNQIKTMKNDKVITGNKTYL